MPFIGAEIRYAANLKCICLDSYVNVKAWA